MTGLTCKGPSSRLSTRRNFWCSDITLFMAVTCSHEPWTSGRTGDLGKETGTGRGQNSPCSRLNPSCLPDTEQGLQLGLSNRPHKMASLFSQPWQRHSGCQMHHSQVQKTSQTFPFAFKAIFSLKKGTWCMHTCKTMCQKQA